VATDGPRACTAGVNIAGALADWTNPANAVSSNNAYATQILAAATRGDYHCARSFGFAIPTGATIDGISVLIEASLTGTTAELVDVFLTKNAGAATVGNDAIAGSQALTATDTNYSYGGPTDVWGTTWTAAEINSNNFGVMTQAAGAASGGTARIDFVSVTIDYTLPPPPDASPVMRMLQNAVYRM
jgi:hypothetical protein